MAVSSAARAETIPVEDEETVEAAPAEKPAAPAKPVRAASDAKPAATETKRTSSTTAAAGKEKAKAETKDAPANMAAVAAPAIVEAPAPVHEAKPAPVESPRNIVMPADGESALVERWRKRADLLAARDARRAEEQLTEIERLREALAFDNLFGISTALVREADALRLSGNGAEALQRCEAAVRVAPGFNAAHLCVARAALSGGAFSPGRALSALSGAWTVTLDDLRSRRHAIADEALTLVFGLVLACAALVVLLILRYAGLFFHDFHHLFPRGTPRWQTAFVALVLVALPWLFGAGALGSVALASVLVAFSVSRSEAVALTSAFALLAATQFAASGAVRAGAFGLVAHDVYIVERGDAPPAAVQRIEKRVQAGQGDYAGAFALARYNKRIGNTVEAARYYRKALELKPDSAEALNNLGNVTFLQNDVSGAIELYRKSNARDPSLAVPLHNVAKMYFREGKLDQGQQAQKAAVEIGGELVRARVGVQDDTRANQYVLDIPLPASFIEALADSDADRVQGIGGPVVQLVTGVLPPSVAALLAIVTALLVVGAQVLQRKLRPASRCEKCGRPVCVRCDPELGAAGGMCAQCVSVFVRRTGVDAPDRIRKEIEVRRFRRRQRILVRFLGLIAGGGHVFAGRIIAGGLFLGLFALAAAQVLFWDGFLHPPVAVLPALSPARIALWAVLFLALYGISFRHLVRYEEGD